NPAAVIAHARKLGYGVTDFVVTYMPFGPYSSQDVVLQRLHAMKKQGKAFFTENGYLVGSAYFTKDRTQRDLSDEFLNCLTSAGSKGPRISFNWLPGRRD